MYLHKPLVIDEVSRHNYTCLSEIFPTSVPFKVCGSGGEVGVRAGGIDLAFARQPLMLPKWEFCGGRSLYLAVI